MEIKTDTNKRLSYSLGVIVANDVLKVEQFSFLNDTLFIKGLSDFLYSKPLISLDSAEYFLNQYLYNGYEREDKIRMEQSINFHLQNEKNENVITTASGLQYEIIYAPKKNKKKLIYPTINDVVKVHYHGTLLDGTVFDSSVDRGEPIELSVSEVIPGWTEALQLMPVGSKWKLFIPYNLAYGPQGAGPIKPYSTLVFDIELIDIVK
jgi:FKBP-type peptidyl-prolyl cis-trans isomerase FklB